MGPYRILPAPLPLVLPPGYTLPDAFGPAAERIWATAGAKVRGLVTRHPGRFPLYTEKGRWTVDAEAWTNWCEGFLGGQLWLLARRTGDPWFRERAEEYSEHILVQGAERGDVGFVGGVVGDELRGASGDQVERDEAPVEAAFVEQFR